MLITTSLSRFLFQQLVRVEEDGGDGSTNGGHSSKIATVYSASLIYPLYKMLQRAWRGEKLYQPKKIYQKPILSNISLYFEPGKSYLVLGPPGSGKTTLLRAIAGRINCHCRSSSDNNTSTNSTKHIPKEATRGHIYYNGRTLQDDSVHQNGTGEEHQAGKRKKLIHKNNKEFHMENVINYIDQLDLHAPRLTVAETFDFAYQCKSAGKTLREADDLLKSEDEEARRLIKKADQEKLRVQIGLIGLGLQGVKDTFVGDTNVRGVSGGQRRRVTVGEMCMERTPVLCGDEVSTGLDAASTYTTVELLLHFSRNSGMTRVLSLLQPSPETVSLFDDVILLGEGRVIYAGPIEVVEDYFANLGYLTPEFMDVADFLQQVSTDDGKQFYHPEEGTQMQPVAPSVSELADIFAASDLGRKIQEQLNAPFSWTWAPDDRNSAHGVSMISGIAKTKAVQRKYANRFGRSTMLILKRFIKLWLRDRRVIIAGAVKNVLMGVSVGGVFANTTNEISTAGALFQGGLFIMLCAMQSASAFAADRLIFYKHTDANFYSAWPFVFGRTLAGAPQTMCDVLIFGTLMYYIIGLADRDSASNFFIYLALLICFALCMQQQLSVFASFATESGLQVCSAIILLLFILFGGYIVAPETIPSTFFVFLLLLIFLLAIHALTTMLLPVFFSRRLLHLGVLVESLCVGLSRTNGYAADRLFVGRFALHISSS
jgi:ABC-type multidrug transport system ATPase subunit